MDDRRTPHQGRTAREEPDHTSAPGSTASLLAKLGLDRDVATTLAQHPDETRAVLTDFATALRSRRDAAADARMAVITRRYGSRAHTKADRAIPPGWRRGDALDRALADARSRGAVRAAEIVSRPEMLSADALAARLGVTRETVNQRRRSGTLLALEGAKRGWRYPDWQLGEDGRPLRGLAEIMRTLGEPWTVYRFLVSTHGGLGGETGLEALRRGRVADAVAAARAMAEGAFG